MHGFTPERAQLAADESAGSEEATMRNACTCSRWKRKLRKTVPRIVIGYFLLALLYVGCRRQSECEGDISIYNSSDIQRIEDCENFKGNIVVFNSGDYRKDIRLGAIEGDVIVHSRFENKEDTWLKNLEIVKGDLILRNTLGKYCIDNISGLKEVTGNVAIESNHDLISVNGFRSLRSIGGSLIIRRNLRAKAIGGFDSLVSIGGTLEILDNVGAKAISGFDSLVSIGGTLEILDNSISELSGFGKLIKIQKGLIIEKNYGLWSITAFGNNINIREKLIIDSNHLINAIGLKKIEKLSAMEVYCIFHSCCMNVPISHYLNKKVDNGSDIGIYWDKPFPFPCVGESKNKIEERIKRNCMEAFNPKDYKCWRWMEMFNEDNNKNKANQEYGERYEECKKKYYITCNRTVD